MGVNLVPVQRHKTHLILLLIGLVCASVNLTKPVHIDDTAHLETAQAILQDALHLYPARSTGTVRLTRSLP